MQQIKAGEIEGVKFMMGEWIAPDFNENSETEHTSCPSWMLPGNEDPDYLRRKTEEEKNGQTNTPLSKEV
jgi:hypothetical protein